MGGLADLAWSIYQNSGPALQLALLALLMGGWKYVVEPRLDDLEEVQATHTDRLDSRALDNRETEVLLADAQDRLDQAEEARASLRERLRQLERRYAADHGMGGGEEGMDLRAENPDSAGGGD